MTEFKDVQVTYFNRPGEHNTARTLELAGARARRLGINTILVATTTGSAGVQAVRSLQGFRLVVVTHSAGFSAPNTQELTVENRRIIEEGGAQLLTCQHAFGGIGRAVRKQLGTYQLEEIVAQTLRIFSQGMKVAVEIALMAADAGLVRAGEPVVSVAGAGSGADTAVVLLPVNAQSFFDLKVQEIVCMPSER